jgi:hypothetical protein
VLDLGRSEPLLERTFNFLLRLAQRKRVMISLIHSLIRAQVEDNGRLDYLLLDIKVRPNSLFLSVIFILLMKFAR